MAAKNQVTVSVEPSKRRPPSVERRKAQIATLATQQATLKQEAADRRRKGARPVPGTSRRSTTPRADRATGSLT